MEITEVRVFPVNEEKLKAFVSIVFDDCFVVSDIKIIHGQNGLFVSMPSNSSISWKGPAGGISPGLPDGRTRRMKSWRAEEIYWPRLSAASIPP